MVDALDTLSHVYAFLCDTEPFIPYDRRHTPEATWCVGGHFDALRLVRKTIDQMHADHWASLSPQEQADTLAMVNDVLDEILAEEQK